MDYRRPPNVYFDSIGIAFRMLSARTRVYQAGALICMLIVFGALLTFALAVNLVDSHTLSFLIADNGNTPALLVCELLGGLLMSILFAGLIGIGLRQALGDEPTLADFFLPFKRPKRTLGAALIYSAPVFVFILALCGFAAALSDPRQPAPTSVALLGVGSFGVLILLFISSFLLLGPLSLGFAAATYGDLPVLRAYKEAFRRLKRKSLLLSILLILSAIASFGGIVLCFLIVLFTFPILPIVIALHYTYYFPPEPQPEPEPEPVPTPETP
jgi:hypothetical protein